MIAARGRGGEIAIYPLTESHHEQGILRRSVAPASASASVLAQAERIAATVLAALDYVGVLGLEMFERDDDAVLVNEFAPRVHNTGHWTLDGCEVDQFEQHIRAIAGWPLGPTAAIAHVEMTNLLGEEALNWARLAREPETRLWLYGKREARPGRKMGHVNRLSPLKRESCRSGAAVAQSAKGGGEPEGGAGEVEAGLEPLEGHDAGDPAIEMDLGRRPPDRQIDGQGGDQNLRQQDALGEVVLVGGRVARPAPGGVGAGPGQPQAERRVGRQAEEPGPAPDRLAIVAGGIATFEDRAGDALADAQARRIDTTKGGERRAIMARRKQSGEVPGARGQEKLGVRLRVAGAPGRLGDQPAVPPQSRSGLDRRVEQALLRLVGPVRGRHHGGVVHSVRTWTKRPASDICAAAPRRGLRKQRPRTPNRSSRSQENEWFRFSFATTMSTRRSRL